MILARKRYDFSDIYPAEVDFKPNKVTIKVMDGRRDRSKGCDYLDEDHSWFYHAGDR